MRKICAGIVLFNPELKRLDDNIDAIKKQVNEVFLIDNCSENIDDILNKYENDKKVIIIQNKKNEGIAFALNQICIIALKKDYQWSLLLDQDSICSQNIIKEYSSYLNEKNLALLTPYIIDINKISYEEYKKMKLPTISEVNWAITSGSLIKLEVWEKLNGFFNELFIDSVDIDYSIKLKINGFKQIRVNSCYLLQEVGMAEKTNIFRPHKDNSGKWTIKRYYRTNHNLIRQYYMTRNQIIIGKKYRNYVPILKSFTFTFLMTLPKPFVERNKLKLLSYLFQGIYDGIIYNVESYKKK